MIKIRSRVETIKHELLHHVPFTLTLSILAGVIVGFLYFFNYLNNDLIQESFEFLHPAHVLFSAMATSAIYMRYKKSIIKSIFIGFFGAILIGTLSDVFLPYFAGSTLGLQTHLHLPIFESPFLIIGIALFGSYLGKYSDVFMTSHSLHIFLSVFASLSYLLAFSTNITLLALFLIVGIVFFVVYIPCCISDIVFPILFIKKPCKECGYWHEHNSKD